MAKQHIEAQWRIYASVNYVCVGKLPIIIQDNGLSPGRRQPIVNTNAGLLSIEHLGTNFSDFFYSKYKSFHSRKCIWKYRPRKGGHFVPGEMS